MDSKSDSLSFSPFDSQGCVIFGIWILDVVHDGLCILMTVNENRRSERQNCSEHCRYHELRGQASNLSHGVLAVMVTKI
jgi:hypothetical protein